MFWQKQKQKLTTGELGEEAARVFLKKKGFKILDQNYQNSKGKRLGEIDIIARYKKAIVFVEVKTRLSNDKSVLPEVNIDRNKLVRLQKIALFYLRDKKLTESDYHFDAVSVLISHDNEVVDIRHLESIFL
jgi:putative endonuclease